MVEVGDLLRLPYDDTLTEAGLTYALQSLHYTYNRMRLAPIPRLRKIVAGIAVEMAFRRWLEREGVHYDLLGATHFTRPDRYDLRLGGRRCDVKSFLISSLNGLRELRADPGYLLEAPALVPLDQLKSDRLGPHDIFIFGFLSGLETHSFLDLQQALAAHRRHHLLYLLTASGWSHPERWHPLGPLALKSNASRELIVELHGQNQQRRPHSERVALSPHVRHPIRPDYYSLLYLHAADLPDGALGIHSPALRQTVMVQPEDWGNIWLYGREILLAGWLSKQDFQRSSRLLPAGEQTRLYRQTRIHNRQVPVRDLRPLGELIELLRESGWAVR